jgi:hypothetical protein
MIRSRTGGNEALVPLCPNIDAAPFFDDPGKGIEPNAEAILHMAYPALPHSDLSQKFWSPG